MKNELTRQCEMAWERGHELGLVQGIVITLAALALIKIVT